MLCAWLSMYKVCDFRWVECRQTFTNSSLFEFFTDIFWALETIWEVWRVTNKVEDLNKTFKKLSRSCSQILPSVQKHLSPPLTSLNVFLSVCLSVCVCVWLCVTSRSPGPFVDRRGGPPGARGSGGGLGGQTGPGRAGEESAGGPGGLHPCAAGGQPEQGGGRWTRGKKPLFHQIIKWINC